MEASTPDSSSKPLVGFVIKRTENEHRPQDTLVREKFNWSLSILLDLTGHEHRAFAALEEPDIIYQFGGWNSISEHYDVMHQSSIVDDFMETFGGVLDVIASYHTDIDSREVAPDVPYFTMLRCRVPQSRIAKFKKASQEWLASLLKSHGTKASYGWRVEGGWEDQYFVDDMSQFNPSLVGRFDDEMSEAEEWNALLPWEKADSWKSEFDGSAFSELLQSVANLEVKHLQLMQTKSL